MSQLRLNLLTGRWVTIVSDRGKRPTDFAPRSQQVETDPSQPCPFCRGNEEPGSTLHEVLGPDDRWQMRVVPNKYPAFEGGESMAVRNLGPVHVMAEASGMHEVVVITPDHNGRVNEFADESIAQLMEMLKARYLAQADAPNVRYSQAFINHGREAGASLAHPHGQLLGLPFVPGEILEEERAFERFKGGCIVCTMIDAELSEGERVVLENDHAVVVTPFWSGGPFEMLIMPRRHDIHLPDSDHDTLAGVGIAIRDALAILVKTLGDVAFNLAFHTAPPHHSGTYHWHVHLWPKLSTSAGFERGTGVLINIVPPEVAAAELRRSVSRV